MSQSICDQPFTEGTISVSVEFEEVDARSMADIILQYDPVSEDMLNVSLGGAAPEAKYGNLFSFRLWTSANTEANPPDASTSAPKQWKFRRWGGGRVGLKPHRRYNITVTVTGSTITLVIDGVELATATLSSQLPGLQVGIFCAGAKDIHFRDFAVNSARPQAFVVMQFNEPEYEALFNNVIAPVCDAEGFKVYRADFTHSPGLIITDITKQITESRVIIAEMTPENGNVYYEVGYADALKKPVILLADSKVGQLPFDVRPYRTIFYENTIGGKEKVESTLRNYLRNLTPKRLPESSIQL